MAGKMEPLPGTSDIWSPEVQAWVRLEDAARKVFSLYGYGEVRTPIFERTDVFVRGLGGETEVVQKEMYTFEDRGGRSLTLRPEGTAGVMRAIINQGLAEGEEKRVFYLGPMFRGERPAAGRKRQFHQIGVEAVGRYAPAADAENIAMLMRFLDVLEIPSTRLLLNSRGTKDDRGPVFDALTAFFKPQIDAMCEDCQRRLDTNVWRILDCKQAACQVVVEGSPAITSLFCPESQAYFDDVRRLLDRMGVPYEVAPRLVRGLDYYEHTVFEVVSEAPDLGAQNAIAGGGRYAIELAGQKRPVQGVGFAAGVERLLLALGTGGEEAMSIGPLDAFVAARGEEGLAAGCGLAEVLRTAGYRVLAEQEGRSMKAQMRTANKVEAPVALILAEQELADGTVTVKEMATSEQQTMPRDQVVAWMRQRPAPCAT